MRAQPIAGARALFVLALAQATAAVCGEADWSQSVILPQGEKPRLLFNGRDLSGWEGQVEKYWSVAEGAIRGANEAAVPVITYLFTTGKYRNFRLLFEVKQTVGEKYSTMHSAVAALGEKFLDQGEPY